MGENKRVIDLKKEKLKKELQKEKPDRNVVKRLKESINRHKEIQRGIKNRRIKQWKKK